RSQCRRALLLDSLEGRRSHSPGDVGPESQDDFIEPQRRNISLRRREWERILRWIALGTNRKAAAEWRIHASQSRVPAMDDFRGRRWRAAGYAGGKRGSHERPREAGRVANPGQWHR